MTTLAFVRSLERWQHAVTAAAPLALFPSLSIVEAAVDPAAAKRWVEFLRVVESGVAQMMAEQERLGTPNFFLRNGQAIVDWAHAAAACAEEHAAELAGEEPPPKEPSRPLPESTLATPLEPGSERERNVLAKLNALHDAVWALRDSDPRDAELVGRTRAAVAAIFDALMDKTVGER